MNAQELFLEEAARAKQNTKEKSIMQKLEHPPKPCEGLPVWRPANPETPSDPAKVDSNDCSRKAAGNQELLYYDPQSRSFWIQEGDKYSTTYRKYRKSDLLNICLTRDSALGGPPRPWELKERRHSLGSIFVGAAGINCVGPKSVLSAELREKNGERLLVRPFPGYAEGPGVAAWRQCFEDYGTPHDAYGRWEALAKIVIKYDLHIHIPQIVHELVIFKWFDGGNSIGQFTQPQYECQIYGNQYQIKGWVRELERENRSRARQAASKIN